MSRPAESTSRPNSRFTRSFASWPGRGRASFSFQRDRRAPESLRSRPCPSWRVSGGGVFGPVHRRGRTHGVMSVRKLGKGTPGDVQSSGSRRNAGDEGPPLLLHLRSHERDRTDRHHFTFVPRFGSTANGFISVNNQLTILRDVASIAIAAWAMTLVIVAGEIDLSTGPDGGLHLRGPGLHAEGSCAVGGGHSRRSRRRHGARHPRRLPCALTSMCRRSSPPLVCGGALRGMALFVTNALPVTFNEATSWSRSPTNCSESRPRRW